jgi:hypothetical protein
MSAYEHEVNLLNHNQRAEIDKAVLVSLAGDNKLTENGFLILLESADPKDLPDILAARRKHIRLRALRESRESEDFSKFTEGLLALQTESEINEVVSHASVAFLLKWMKSHQRVLETDQQFLVCLLNACLENLEGTLGFYSFNKTIRSTVCNYLLAMLYVIHVRL